MICFSEGSRQMMRVMWWDWWEIDIPILKLAFGGIALSPFCVCPILKLWLRSLGLMALFGRVWDEM